jgi:chloramphenicol 3-O-phosphotransferase
MATGEGTMTLAEKITAVENEIAHWLTLHAAAVAEGNDQKQISLLNVIAERGKYLNKLKDDLQHCGRRLAYHPHGPPGINIYFIH